MDLPQGNQEEMMDAGLMHQSLSILGQKRLFSDDLDMSFPGQDDDRPIPKKKGRKKSFIWSHVVTDENGKVHCLHCGLLIRVNIGEKVERLRKHFVKSCSKNPFHKDSKEYEELLESVATPNSIEGKKKSGSSMKAKHNRIITYSITFVNSILSGSTIDLMPDQIKRLESLGNRSTNWSSVKFTGAPTMSYDSTIERIRNCHFSGTVYIGLFLKSVSLDHGIQVPSGLYNSNFSGTCILSDNCYVWNTTLVANVFLGRNTCVMNCGSIICNGQSSYGTQRTICVGAESDGPNSPNSRSTTLNVNMSYGEVCTKLLVPRRSLPSPQTHMDSGPDIALFMNMASDLMASSNTNNNANAPGNLQLAGNLNPAQQSSISGMSNASSHTNAIAKKHLRARSSDDHIRYDLAIICDDVEISHCATISNVFIGGYCKVKSSTLVNSSLLSNCTVSNSEVDGCIMHGSCSIEGKSLVSGVLMFPHSHISDGAIVSESILGPDSSVGVGEVKRSILGPFTGFHHTGLLIASLWPLGRGNIGYGAMIGANHTSRSNDQECLPGEGVFFGLASAIRFPFSMLMSPYSIVAANTVCLPQRLAFPFSLIARNETVALQGVVDTSLCSLRPAWCLWANAYFLERSLSKFSKRRKSTEYRTDFPVFRPAIVDMVLDARNRLLQMRALVNPAHSATAPASASQASLDAETTVDDSAVSACSNEATAKESSPVTGNDSQGNGRTPTGGVASSTTIDTNLYLRGSQVDALGGGRCLIAAKDIDVAYEAYTQFVLRYALHGLLYMLVTGEGVAVTAAAAAIPSTSHGGSHLQSHLHSQTSQHQGSARAYLRTSASLVGASPDSDSEDDVDHSLRVFGQSTPSNHHKMNINSNSTGTNGHNSINRPSALFSTSESAPVPPSGVVSFLLDDLRRMDHNTGNLENALLRAEARSNRESQQQIRQQQQMYQQMQQHHQQQHSSSQMHHITQQQLYQQQQQARSNVIPHGPTQHQQQNVSGNVTMLGPSENSPGTAQSAVLQQHSFLTLTSTPNANNDPQLGIAPMPVQHQHLFQHQPQLPQQPPSIASTMGILLFGRSGPAGPHAAGAGTASSSGGAVAAAAATSPSNLATPATGVQGSTTSVNVLNGGLLPLQLHEPYHSSNGQHLGQVCLLTDSHDVAVRQHQLHVLSEMFPEIDFSRFVEAFARWVMMSGSMTAQPMTAAYQSVLASQASKVQALLIRLVELERYNADAVFSSKQKDAHRSLEIIVGSADRSQDIDDVIARARSRSEDVTFVVRRLFVYFSQFGNP